MWFHFVCEKIIAGYWEVISISLLVWKEMNWLVSRLLSMNLMKNIWMSLQLWVWHLCLYKSGSMPLKLMELHQYQSQANEVKGIQNGKQGCAKPVSDTWKESKNKVDLWIWHLQLCQCELNLTSTSGDCEDTMAWSSMHSNTYKTNSLQILGAHLEVCGAACSL